MNNTSGEDKYSVVSNGTLLPKSELSDFNEFVIHKLKLDEKKTSLFVDGRKRILKKGLTRIAADKTVNIFRLAGLDVALGVDFSASDFKHSLVDSELMPSPLQDRNTSEALFVPLDKLAPLIFCPASEISVNNKFNLKINSIIGFPFLMLLSVISALYIQTYVLKYLSFSLGMQTGVTALGIVIFFSLILYLPLIVVNNRNLVLSSPSISTFKYNLKSHGFLNLLNTNYRLIKNGDVISTFNKKRFKSLSVKCLNESGDIIFSTSSSISTLDASRDSANEVISNIAITKALDYLETIKNVRDILKVFSVQSAETSVDEMELACVILNNRKKVVAKIYKGVNVGVEIYQSDYNEDDIARLFLMGLLASGLS